MCHKAQNPPLFAANTPKHVFDKLERRNAENSVT